MEQAYLIISTILLLPGLLGVILPALPGIPYMFVITLIYAALTKFTTLTTSELLVLLSLAVISISVDYLSGILGARYGGAHKKSLLLGFLGMLIGLFILPPFGSIIGLFLGVMIAEIMMHNDKDKAFKAAAGSLIGTLSGIAINLVLGITYIILFIIFSLN